MDHIDPAVEDARFAEEQECTSGLETFVGVFDPLEEYQFHRAAGVLYRHCEAFGTLPLRHFRRDDRPEDLDIGILAPYIRDLLDGTPVHVAERIHAEKVPDRHDFQLGTEQGCPLGSHSGQILDFRIEFVPQHRLIQWTIYA